MKVVIDIHEGLMKVIDDIKDESFINQEIHKVISNGTVLPKEHGRLMILSEDAVKREQTYLLGFSCQKWIDEVGLSNATVAIIEADECTYEETGCGSCKRQLDCSIEADRSKSEV